MKFPFSKSLLITMVPVYTRPRTYTLSLFAFLCVFWCCAVYFLRFVRISTSTVSYVLCHHHVYCILLFAYRVCRRWQWWRCRDGNGARESPPFRESYGTSYPNQQDLHWRNHAMLQTDAVTVLRHYIVRIWLWLFQGWRWSEIECRRQWRRARLSIIHSETAANC